MPERIARKLGNCYRSHAQRNLFVTSELLRVLRLLEKSGIAALPYKGPVLAASVYGDVSMRSFSDLDILVHKHDVLRAKDLILSHGYRSAKTLTSGQEIAHLRSKHGKDFGFIDLNDSVKLELHWELAILALFPLETRSLWDRLEPFQVGGMSVLNLAPEDLLLTLCVHGGKHFFKRLEWICDISELLAAKPGICWGTVIDYATKLHSKRLLFLGLILARDLLGAELPEEISLQIRADRYTGLLAARVQKTLFSGPDRLSSLAVKSSEVIKRDVHVITLRERRRDRMLLFFYYFGDYLRAVLTPNEEDKSFFRLPGFFSFLYHVVRPIRLVKAYGLNLLTQGNQESPDSDESTTSWWYRANCFFDRKEITEGTRPLVDDIKPSSNER